MTRIEKHIVVARPMEEVFDVARDWRTIPKYLDYIQGVTPLTTLTEGVGARFLVRLTFLGRKMTSEWETIEYLGQEGWTYTAALMGVTAIKRWRFEPLGESTRVTATLEYEPKPAVVAPIVDALVLRRAWDRIYERGLQNLKGLVESTAAPETVTSSSRQVALPSAPSQG